MSFSQYSTGNKARAEGQYDNFIFFAQQYGKANGSTHTRTWHCRICIYMVTGGSPSVCYVLVFYHSAVSSRNIKKKKEENPIMLASKFTQEGEN